MKVNDRIFREDVVMTNMEGDGYSEINDEFMSGPNTFFWLEHIYDNNMNQNGKAVADVKLLFRNGMEYTSLTNFIPI
jgi:hypothetical protein